MAVQTYLGAGYQNTTASQAPRMTFAEGQDKNIYSLINIANGDSIGSLAYLGRVPSDARLTFHNSLILTSVNAGLTSFSLGLALTADPAKGSLGSPPNPVPAALSLAATCLMNAVDIHAANSYLFGPATGSWGNLFWQIMGLATDPGGYLDVIGTLNTASTAASTLELFLEYVRGGP
jgi:hypothetical protein